MNNSVKNILVTIIFILSFILATPSIIYGQTNGKNQQAIQAIRTQERPAYSPAPFSPLWTPPSTKGSFQDNYDHALEQAKAADRVAADKAKAAAAAERARIAEERAKAKQEAKNKKLKNRSPRLSKKRGSNLNSR